MWIYNFNIYFISQFSIVSGKSDDNNNRKRRVVIVTGSGKGISKAIATEFAKAGYYVMINDFEKEEELKLQQKKSQN